MNIGDEKETVFAALPEDCDQHHGDPLRIYCFECQSAICMMCYVMAHNSHKCSDVKAVADTFRGQMASDVGKTVAGVEKCRNMLQCLEKEMNDFDEQIVKAKGEISEKAEQLKLMIDIQKEKLVNELS